ncbi:TPA: IS66 family insertion sequence element accessory protein TnpA [Vibrio diabolicus]|uniref:IS66 family insertion sequence element accessory protein TnpA n=1 Tax=Vibrio diabolicus TaxID=50719 RepID=UPI002160FC23|nr:IS66 family insertion sequence element accessory protein TnpB [Vibrio diabolicus]MCS0451067.1 IS66 family insertion sequence element accessory protein TnpB [Vibrio diabolicus]
MAKRRTDQDWKNLFEQYQSSQLSQRVFCERHGMSVSTFYAKRQQLQCPGPSQTGGFIKAEVVEKTTRYQMAQTPVANMTLFINDVELSTPQGTPAAYLAELIGALS